MYHADAISKDEISTYECQKLPASLKDLAAFINEFNLTNIQQQRGALWQQRDFDVAYEKNKSFDKDWVGNMIHSILMEMECCQLSQEHLEVWYISHICSVSDGCSGDLDAVNVIRENLQALLLLFERTRIGLRLRPRSYCDMHPPRPTPNQTLLHFRPHP
jgi:hypothetical protein